MNTCRNNTYIPKKEIDVNITVKEMKDTSKEMLTYKVFKDRDHELQLKYIRSSIEEIRGTNKIKLISPNFERVISLEELSEDLLSDVSFLITDVPLTQKIVDRFFNSINSNLVIIGREIYLTKKPPNLKILRYEDVMS